MSLHPLPEDLAPNERRKRFGLLLLAIAAAFAVQGISTPGRWEQVIVTGLLAVTLLLALRVAEVDARVFRPVSAIAVLLTTTGYGDLTAATNLGRTLSVSEALVGQIYLVTIVAVIVGNLGWGGPTERQD